MAKRYSQPQIGPTKLTSEGLNRRAIVANANAANPQGVSNGSVVVTGSPSRIIVPSGIARTYAANQYDNVSHGVTASEYTLVALCLYSHTGALAGILDDDDVSTRVFQFRFNNYGVDFIPFDTGGTPHTITINAATVGAPWAAGTNVFSVIVARGHAAGADVFWNKTKASTSFSNLKPLRPNFWVGNLKTAQTSGNPYGILGYAAFGSALSDGEINSIIANPWQIFRAPSLPLFAAAAGGGAAALAGNASAIASAAGALSTAIPVAGAAVGVVTATGALSTAMNLSGAAAAVASASGQLKVGIAISGLAIAAAVATGALGTQFELTGGAQAIANATGAMQIQIALSGAAIAQAIATGAISIGSSSALAGNAQVQASASGSLSVALPLAGNAQVVASASGNLGTGTALAGAAVAVAAASGNLVVTVSLSGTAVAQAIAAGGMLIQVPLAGAAVLQASANGYLSAGQDFVALGSSPRIGHLSVSVNKSQIGSASRQARQRRISARRIGHV